jgi:hypothetical protein
MPTVRTLIEGVVIIALCVTVAYFGITTFLEKKSAVRVHEGNGQYDDRDKSDDHYDDKD